MMLYIHCHDCGEHTEIRSTGDSQEFCPCSSIDWQACADRAPGECAECDEIAGREVCRRCKKVEVRGSGDWCQVCYQDAKEAAAERRYDEMKEEGGR